MEQNVTTDNIKRLLSFSHLPPFRNKFRLILLGVLFTPVSLIGALLGYVKAYYSFDDDQKEPDLENLTPIYRHAMKWGVFLAWGVLVAGAILFALLLKPTWDFIKDHAWSSLFVTFYLSTTAYLTAIVFGFYFAWQIAKRFFMREKRRHGTARLGTKEDQYNLQSGEGIYIGGDLGYKEKGHIFTIGSTRSGKGDNLVIPALLDATVYAGSLVVIDPKGENAAVTARYQKEKGQQVILLDPWQQQPQVGGYAFTANGQEKGLPLPDPDYVPHMLNPLDLLDVNSPHLVDDVMVLAEMIVPVNPGAKDPFWDNSARSIIAGLLLFCALEKLNLASLWQLTRDTPDGFKETVADMATHDHPGVRAAGNEIMSLQKTETTFSSVMANVRSNTDFLRSPAIQKSTSETNFPLADLTKGKLTIYVIIPADKLRSHSQWLRLIVTMLMRIAVRNYSPYHRVTFLLDEFPSLGYLPEVSEFGLAAAAGYNISLWMIAQSLPQMELVYGKSWQNFIANTNVRQYVGVNDNDTTEYVSKSMGTETHLNVERKPEERGRKSGPIDKLFHSSPRALRLPDEVRVESDGSIILQVERRPTMIIPKQSYRFMPALAGRFDPNPYHVKQEPVQDAAA